MVRQSKYAGFEKITPQKARVLVSVFEKVGYHRVRQKGSHIIMRRDDDNVPIAIPDHPSQEIQSFLIIRLLKEAGISREEYFRLLKEV
jgi:predicted RNA binding protein YcfA (HicA-like mRNA interferase family)